VTGLRGTINFSLHFATRLATSPFHFLEIKSSANTNPFTFYDGSAIAESIGERDHVFDSQMVTLPMKVLHELVDRPAKRSFAEEDHFIHALPLDRENETLSKGILLRAPYFRLTKPGGDGHRAAMGRSPERSVSITSIPALSTPP